MMGQLGFWDLTVRYEKLEAKKDLLSNLNELMPGETFRPILEQIRDKPRKRSAGRRATDVVLMFKMLILQQLYNISDEALEYQVNDRLSFMRFLGLGIADSVPDATTVWLFREQLQKHDLVEVLFEEFGRYLQASGYQAQQGQIVDATLIPVPKQRNTKAENKQVKAGEIPEGLASRPTQTISKRCGCPLDSEKWSVLFRL